MAYRRRQQVPRASAFDEEIGSPYFPSPPPDDSSSSSSASSLVAKAIRASSAYRDSSLSSAYRHSAVSSSPDPNIPRSPSPSVPKDSTTYEYTSMKSLSDSKHGFWGVLARKAKTILDNDTAAQQFETPGRTRQQMSDTTKVQCHNLHHSHESQRKTDGHALQKGLETISSSLNYIGGTIGSALEGGLTIVENRTADIIQETRKLQMRKKSSEMQTDLETQLKASRDVAMAMAAKAKMLLRELKTVKADLAFGKERCAQLEEENRIRRESRDKGGNLEDDDLVRLQLETLLAEKARLAQENSVLARENRFLREIVEYHQLTMQDVVYLDEGSEEVTEVYPIKDYAFRAFVRPRTGIPYGGHVPSNLAGIEVSALRLRSGSLRRKGFNSYKEFDIPIGIVEQPYVERLVLVYHNLANWSSSYYPLPGYSYLAPVLGLLAYNASNLSATNIPELDIRASETPILIKFSNMTQAPAGLSPKCVNFGLDGSVKLNNVSAGNVCSATEQGHFSIVVESTAIPPAPAPSRRDWIIVGCVIGGSVFVFLWVLLALWVKRSRYRKRLQRMEQTSEGSISLQMTSAGNSRAPMAMGSRTRPLLENEYVP
ncbi:hypothetical protein F0562_002149 [Nyssa sinensis]|uniref:Uncharacterized protein n=1 Tax=Nyssa sinensis TaxID=561372 RepID=A0A5J5C542_9ASTE|nr:hypothetical protein F0562_002149 [Nyssa sinensis]